MLKRRHFTIWWKIFVHFDFDGSKTSRATKGWKSRSTGDRSETWLHINVLSISVSVFCAYKLRNNFRKMLVIVKLSRFWRSHHLQSTISSTDSGNQEESLCLRDKETGGWRCSGLQAALKNEVKMKSMKYKSMYIRLMVTLSSPDEWV